MLLNWGYYARLHGNVMMVVMRLWIWQGYGKFGWMRSGVRGAGEKKMGMAFVKRWQFLIPKRGA